MSDAVEEMGPVDYLVVEFPGNRMTGEGLPLLVDLVDRGIIRLLDLVFVRKDEDGSVSVVELADLGEEVDLSVFSGVSSGLMGQEDIDEAGAVLEPGNSAALVIYENVWAAPLAQALRRSGAQLVAGGRVPVQALLASLEAAEATPPGSGPAAA
ncbi:DUF1269 domain-containing protein [Streptomyces actuosus]|uniref:DUF1269 domain-containing protein n=1 Tax=Streptomyces actuosus TaxID=1885 RepID=A0ABS2VN39_STRAS|nr:DUF6325 family protein [Streptomyces actuosus]MBN0044530.1 DUF1269 domain-containing protein [Streptomyces actuosus]